MPNRGASPAVLKHYLLQIVDALRKRQCDVFLTKHIKQLACQTSPAVQSNPFLANRRGYPHLVSNCAWFAAALG